MKTLSCKCKETITFGVVEVAVPKIGAIFATYSVAAAATGEEEVEVAVAEVQEVVVEVVPMVVVAAVVAFEC